MKRLWFSLIPVFLLASACAAEVKPRGQVEAATNDELGERMAIQNRASELVRARDFAALSAMATEFRTRRSRTPSGTWKLSAFYRGVGVGLANGAGEDAPCTNRAADFATAWAGRDPGHPSPYIVQAMGIVGYAWCLRGEEAAADTPVEAMRGFLRELDSAYELLEMHREVASVDPQFYTLMVGIYKGQGRNRWSFGLLLDEAADREPYYYDTYFAAASYYSPNWMGGGRDIDWVGRYAADRTREGDGKGAYARVFWSALESYSEAGLQIDWGMMEEAMDDVSRAYPNEWNDANFARLSCHAGRLETATTFVKKLNQPAGWADWMDCPASVTGLDEPRRQLRRTNVPLQRSTEMCPFAARQAWTRDDVDKYCSEEAIQR